MFEVRIYVLCNNVYIRNLNLKTDKKPSAQFPLKRQMFAFEKDFKIQQLFVSIPWIILCKADNRIGETLTQTSEPGLLLKSIDCIYSVWSLHEVLPSIRRGSRYNG